MTRPYSMDLQERAIARIEAGESVRTVASALSISAATVVRWSQRYSRFIKAHSTPIRAHHHHQE